MIIFNDSISKFYQCSIRGFCRGISMFFSIWLVKKNAETIKEKQESKNNIYLCLRLVSAIFYRFFIFSPNVISSKTMINVFILFKKLFLFSRYLHFCKFALPFQTLQIQKDKWKWNNIWCQELTCIKLHM